MLSGLDPLHVIFTRTMPTMPLCMGPTAKLQMEASTNG
jgi:hypothetical protein